MGLHQILLYFLGLLAWWFCGTPKSGNGYVFDSFAWSWGSSSYWVAYYDPLASREELMCMHPFLRWALHSNLLLAPWLLWVFVLTNPYESTSVPMKAQETLITVINIRLRDNAIWLFIKTIVTGFPLRYKTIPATCFESHLYQ